MLQFKLADSFVTELSFNFMLDGKRRVNKDKLLNIREDKISYDLSIANLRIEKEILNKQNIESAIALESKRKSLNLDYKACEKIEKEHFDKVDKLQDEYAKLFNKFEDLKEECERLETRIGYLNDDRESLLKSMPILNEDKLRLENEIEETINKLNETKSNANKYIANITEKIENLNKEYQDIDGKLLVAKEEHNSEEGKTKC